MLQLSHPSLRVEESVLVRFTPAALRDDTLRGVLGQLVRLVNEKGWREVHLDLVGVEFPTAGGLGHLVALHAELRAAGARLVLCNVGGVVREVFELTGLTRVLEVRPKRGWPA